MAPKYTSPSVGLNAATGGILTGWPHVVQSLQDIFTTQFGTRCSATNKMRIQRQSG